MTDRSNVRLRPRAGRLVLLTSGMLLAAACGVGESEDARERPAVTQEAAAQYPVTVSSCGQDYPYEVPPSRVVLGYPRTLETLVALGVDDAVYGYVHGAYDALPDGYPADVVEVSPDYQPSREVMIGAQPDLFLSNDEGQVTGDGTVGYDDLASMGSQTYVLGGYCSAAPASRRIDVIYDDIEALGQIFGVPDAAATLIDEVEGRVAAAAELTADQDLQIAYVQVFDGKLYAISGYPVAGVITALGQTNEFEDLKQNFAEISKEEALTREPDVLFVNYVGADNREAAVAEVEALLASTPAVAAGRVYAADETDFYAGGVAIIDHLEEAAEAISTP